MVAERPFYYLHIPKTAGTTFCYSVLPQLFHPSEICSAHDYPELLPMAAGGLEKYRLFRGHFYYFFTRLLPVKPVFMTFLRDPVERVLSNYDHVCRDERHYHYALIPKGPDGLRSALDLPRLLPPNLQVLSIACDLDPVRVMHEARQACPNGLDEYSVIAGEMTKRLSNRADLAIARRRLEEMEFVGIVEHFDDSLKLLCETFGWPIPSYERMNVTPARTRRENLDPGVVRKIIDTNELDVELYEYAKSIFFRRLGELGGKRVAPSSADCGGLQPV